MTDTATEGSSAHVLEGMQDRLGDAHPILPNLPHPPQSSVFAEPDGARLATVSDDMSDGSALGIPTLPTPTLPTSTLPTLPSPTLPSPAMTAPATPAHLSDPLAPAGETPDGAPAHPMAHLMPGKSVPSEASQRAAALRAAKKAKSRKIKIAVTVVAIAFTALVGPPLGRWLVDAINEAGSTEPDQPAPTVAPAD